MYNSYNISVFINIWFLEMYVYVLLYISLFQSVLYLLVSKYVSELLKCVAMFLILCL